jgi:mannose-6-phosphate isomerase-like protein (cupin superfamily)
MNTGLIETYCSRENGYHPFFIREHWQVAQLNYLSSLSFTSIEQLELHKHTDEIFVLTRGKAVLIAAGIENLRVRFECILMQPGVTYNIPGNTWHTIAMDKEAELIIVEKSNTHLGDCLYYPLSETDKEKLKNQILQLVNQTN